MVSNKKDAARYLSFLKKIEASEKTYKIVRFYQKDHPKQVIKTGLSFKEAQKHCNDPETSSSTCKNPKDVARTKKWETGLMVIPMEKDLRTE